MTATKRFRLGVAFFWALAGMPRCPEAQFGAFVSPGLAAQARSQNELDSYLEIVTATNSREVLQKVQAFISEFPTSELLGAAFQYQLQAFERLNDFDGMLSAGEKALAGNPDNLDTLLTLAPALADHAAGRLDETRLLSQAEFYAQRALDGIDKVRIPHDLSIEEWNSQKREMRSVAHGALGVVALRRGQLKMAVGELEMAISLASRPQGVQFLRLGLALAAAGKKQDAEQKLNRAAELGPDTVRDLALDQLKKLRTSPLASR